MDSSGPTENRQRRTDAARAVPQSEANSKSHVQRVQNKDRASTVTACTRNDAIPNQTHEDGKDFRRARYSQSGCYQDLSTEAARACKHPVRDRRCMRKPNDANMRRSGRVKKTSRAKSIWHEESNQIATVLNSIHQFQIQAHRLDRNRSTQEINKHISDKRLTSQRP